MGSDVALDLPLDPSGTCMCCKEKPKPDACLRCGSCASPWHIKCLRTQPTHRPEDTWMCPDCDGTAEGSGNGVCVASDGEQNLSQQLRSIENDSSLTDDQKAKRRQEHFRGPEQADGQPSKKQKVSEIASKNGSSTLEILDEKMNCIFCLQVVDRPVTTPCGHNFCLKCFEKWVGQGKRTCAKCRAVIPPKMASQPRINAALVAAIRIAKQESQPQSRTYTSVANESKPEKAFTTERAVKTGKANACSGRIFVTIAPDHFGPITAEFDPLRNKGVSVGEQWEDRMECRQWGAHFPHVAGIAGQSDHGAQSVALSGGYEDDIDKGDHFLYTGSGGRDLSGNKRTNKEHSFDQRFESANEALRVSCRNGYPVRVVRSHKERSNYAPESGVRYDGIYRIEKCWRKKGAGVSLLPPHTLTHTPIPIPITIPSPSPTTITTSHPSWGQVSQGHLVCRYLFVRCDNEPAAWASEAHGDRPRDLPNLPELKGGIDLTEREGTPAWDWKSEEGKWGWTRVAPCSKKVAGGSSGAKRNPGSHQKRLLREFGCQLCGKVLSSPVSTSCGHNFCRPCLFDKFGGKGEMRERGGGGRELRRVKVAKPCPATRCCGDIGDLLLNPQVNLELVDIIESLQKQAEVARTEVEIPSQ